jgi:hypothetical protein
LPACETVLRPEQEANTSMAVRIGNVIFILGFNMVCRYFV